MSTRLTSKGQVTIPKHIRDAVHLQPGSLVEFSVNGQGEIVLRPPRAARAVRERAPDRFDAVRGSADVPWRTDELMKLLRSQD